MSLSPIHLLSLRQSCCRSLARVRCCGQNHALTCAVPLGDHLATSIPEVAGNGPIRVQTGLCVTVLWGTANVAMQRLNSVTLGPFFQLLKTSLTSELGPGLSFLIWR